MFTLDTYGIVEDSTLEVSITSPSQHRGLQAIITVPVSASNDTPVEAVPVRQDSPHFEPNDIAPQCTFPWNLSRVKDGEHIRDNVDSDMLGNKHPSQSETAYIRDKRKVSVASDPALVVSVPEVSEPAYLEPFHDPTFGARIVRISGNAGENFSWDGTPPGSGTWGVDVRHHYSIDQPWNSDGTLLFLQNRGGDASPRRLLLDGHTFKPKYGMCDNFPKGASRWHPSKSHPHERINIHNDKLQWFDMVRCKRTRHWSLPFEVSLGEGKGNPSNDGRFLALSDGKRVFVVDMDPQPPFAPYPEQRIGPPIDVTDCGVSYGCEVAWISVSPSGKYVVVRYRGPKTHTRVYDVNSQTLTLKSRKMPALYPNCIGTPNNGFIYGLGHADMTLNPFDNNEDVIVGQEHCGNRGKTINSVKIGGVVMVRLHDGVIKSLTDPRNEAYPQHISARNYQRPGWVYVTYYENADGRRFNDEIVAIRLDGIRTVERYAHKHALTKNCYRCESHAVPSPDGTKIIFASPWNLNCADACGTGSEIRAYVIEGRPLNATAMPTN